MPFRPAVLPASRSWARTVALVTLGAMTLVGFGAAVVTATIAFSAQPDVVVPPGAPIVITPPAPIVVVRELAPPPAPEPPAPPEPPPPPPKPPTHVTCAANIATIGVPLPLVREDKAAPFSPYTIDLKSGPADLKAVASTDGCTIATWTADKLTVSWDGGQTFFPVPHDIPAVQVAVTAKRVVILGSTDLGILTPTDATPTIHPFPAIPELAEVGLQLVVGGDHIALASTKIIAVTDDGDAYRYLQRPTLPATDQFIMLRDISADGELTAYVQRGPAPNPNEPTEYDPFAVHTVLWSTSITSARWRERSSVEATWTYSFQVDKYWGCGSSEKLVAHYRGNDVDLAGGLRGEVWPVKLVFSPHGGYTLHGEALYRLRGGSEISIDAPVEAIDNLVGVDQYGSLLAVVRARLVRWSEAGGWRVLQ